MFIKLALNTFIYLKLLALTAISYLNNRFHINYLQITFKIHSFNFEKNKIYNFLW